MHISCIIYIIKGQKHCFEMLLPFLFFIQERKSARRSAGFAIRSKGECFFFVGGLQIPRF